ncbi:PEP-utilizing enzyme [Rhodococcus jostii]|uniref:PEP-utilizing enzyme n=1 Tax=Rhodococcus jostii TaxID=132919 RepID=UPI00365F9314
MGLFPMRGELADLQGVFFGRLCGRADAQAAALRYMPGFDPAGYFHDMYGFPRGSIDIQSSNRRLPIVLVKTLYGFAATPRRLKALEKESQHWWLENTAKTMTPASARALFAEAIDRHAAALYVHTYASTFGPAFLGAVAKLAAAAGKPELAGHAVTSGSLRETTMLTDIWRLSRDEITLDDFISAHGFYGPDPAELSEPSWRESSASIHKVAASYHGKTALSPADRIKKQGVNKDAAVAELLESVDKRQRISARLVIRLAQQWVPYREIGKAAFLQAFDCARHAASAIGKDLYDSGLVDAPDDVFYLTADEILGALPSDVRAQITFRRLKRTEHHAVRPPSSWIGNPDPLPVETAMASNETLAGTGVSPGVFEGKARVILDPGSCEDALEPYEILVARTTDPSWASMFMSAGALVIDQGNSVSHAAIIARELGIPCVMGTIHGTASIVDGSILRVDGSTGAVEVIDQDIELTTGLTTASKESS